MIGAPAAPPLGLIRNEKAETYHASGCVGSGMIRAYLDDPAACKARYIDRNPEWQVEETDAIELGTAVHLLAEGGRGYADRYLVAGPEHLTDSGKLSTKKATVALADQLALAGSKIITPADDDWHCFIFDRIASNPVAERLLRGTEREVTGRMTDPHTQLIVQARWDVFHTDWQLDIKTSGMPLDRWKRYGVRDSRATVQAALYTALHRALVNGDRVPFYWLFIQTCYPFTVRVIECPEGAIDAAMLDIDRALTGIAACDWGSVQNEPETLECP